jgi:hypothetical protein
MRRRDRAENHLNDVLGKSDYGGRVLPPATRLSDLSFGISESARTLTLIFVQMDVFFAYTPALAIGSAEKQSIAFKGCFASRTVFRNRVL